MVLENLVLRLAGISHHFGEIDEASRRSMINLVRKAKSSIKIVSGELNFDFYSYDGLLDALKEAIEKGVVVKCIIGPNPNKESFKMLTRLKGCAYFYQLPEWPDFHFTLIDDKHARLEAPHTPGQKVRDEYIIHNFKDVEELKERFDKLEKLAVPVETA